MNERNTFAEAAFELIAMRFILEADKYTRAEFALLEDTPPAILAKLAEDKEVVVRMTVAKNPSTPEYPLEKLLGDLYEDVRKAAIENLKSRTPKAHD